MAKVKIQGHASGTGILTVTAPNTSTDRTITLPDATCTLADNSDVTTKLPLAGGTMTGALVVGSTGNTPLTIQSTYSTGGYAELQLGASGATTGYLGSAEALVSGGAAADISVRAQANLVFSTGGNTERLKITSDGRGVSAFTAKAWVNFNGTGTIAIRNSHNVSSITDQAVGDYYYTMSNAITDTNPTIINGFSERDCHCATDYAANTTTQIHLEACNVNGTKGDKGYVVSLCFR